MLGSQPWWWQQLEPYTAAWQASRSESSSNESAAEEGILAGVPWPLLLSCMGDNTTTMSTTTSSSSSSSRRATCQCQSPTCYLCTPPPPVTLQQLRLALEVVCLTCRESTDEALHAPALLALLLQRADAALRAAFLNSADGVRLLVALQQASDHVVDARDTWCFLQHHGAVLLPDAAVKLVPVPPVTQAALTLAWCFMEAVPGATTAAAASQDRTPAAGRVGAGLVMPGAVGHGSAASFNKYGNGEYAAHCSRVSVYNVQLGMVASNLVAPQQSGKVAQLLE
jgi:hypothetical protein